MTKHIDTVMAGCARTLYGLRMLRAHGMSQACLQIDFRLTALAKLLYVSPAWWGFANASEKNRLEVFLRRAGKWSYYTDDFLPTIAALCERADKQLFRSIKYKPTHSIRPLLPPDAVQPIAHVCDCVTTNFPRKWIILMSAILSIVYCTKTVFSCFLTCQYVVHCVYSGVSFNCFNKNYYHQLLLWHFFKRHNYCTARCTLNPHVAAPMLPHVTRILLKLLVFSNFDNRF